MTAAIVINKNSMSLANTDSVINENLIAQWLKFADVSEKSIKTYTKAIRRFVAYINSKGIVAPTADDVYEWRNSMKTENKSAATINLYLTSCKLFFKFLNQRGIYKVDISRVKSCKLTTEHKRDALTAEQGRTVLNSFDTTTLIGLRNKAMTALMMTCGLRTIEVSRANVGDLISTYGRTALFVQGKGRTQKAECVMIPAQVEALINQYLEARGTVDANAPLFAGIGNRNRVGRLTTDAISRIVKKSFRSVGIDSKRLTAHSLRHSAATQMLLAGISLENVKNCLRHKKLDTTLIYSHHIDRLKNHAEEAAANAFFA